MSGMLCSLGWQLLWRRCVPHPSQPYVVLFNPWHWAAALGQDVWIPCTNNIWGLGGTARGTSEVWDNMKELLLSFQQFGEVHSKQSVTHPPPQVSGLLGSGWNQLRHGCMHMMWCGFSRWTHSANPLHFSILQGLI